MLIARFVARVVSVCLVLFATGTVSGQDYPNKPIRIVAGAAGGGGDFAARIVAQGIAGPLGQQVIVDNRAAPILAAEFVSKAPADGSTLYVSGNSIWIAPLLQKTPYDAVRDFAPVTVIVREVSVVVVHPSLPVKSIKELIALTKAKPGELNYGSAGIGSIAHLAGELFKSMAGVNLEVVQYKGGAAAITALISGEVQSAILDPRLAAPHVKSGKLRALAVTSATPSLAVPGLPTVSASGVPGYEAIGMTSMLAPAKTPAAIVNRLHQEIVRALNLPDVKEKFLNSGAETVGSSPEQFAATIKSEIAKWDKVIKDTGIKL
jgi:tripartite-type tricarboxylate transporter receptor subunit TctC